jgi:O-methyltransferase
MKEGLKQAVIRMGLGGPARRIRMVLGGPVRRMRRTLHALGLTRWEPLVPEDAFSACVSNAIEKLRGLEPAETFGVYLEFGVSRGTSMACVYRCLRAAGLIHTRLIGFDSFEGMPPEAAEEGWVPGQYRSTIAATRRYLAHRDVDLRQVTLVKGWFRDTLTEETRKTLAIGKASVILIDCDIYSASKEALRFSEPHIGRYAVVLFDDWGSRERKGEIGQKEVFEEFLAENRDISAEPLPSYLPHQAHVFLLKRGKP